MGHSPCCLWFAAQGQVSTILAIVAMSLIDQDIDLEDPSLEITAILQSALWIGTLGIRFGCITQKEFHGGSLDGDLKEVIFSKVFLSDLEHQIAAGLLYLPLYVIFDDIDVSEPAKRTS